jgi:hypothetical protein
MVMPPLWAWTRGGGGVWFSDDLFGDQGAWDLLAFLGPGDNADEWLAKAREHAELQADREEARGDA